MPTEPLRVAIAGLGTVGGALYRRLVVDGEMIAGRAGRPIEVTAVSARRRSGRVIDPATTRWFDDPVVMATAPDIDVVVELIGGADGPAKAIVEASLAAGRPIVTANKALLAHHGMDLARRAEAAGVCLSFEAAVAGGIPVVKTLREGLAGNRIERVYGILNGTCNYILSRMEAEGLGFETCLGDAQRLGYAEADPSFDIDGSDAAHKLAILTSLAFGTAIDVDAVHIEGIRAISPVDLKAADELGLRVKLLGVAQRTDAGLETRVHPTMVPKGSPLAEIRGVTNAVSINGDAVRELTLVGPGAGGDATASAVLADLIDIARGFSVPPLGRPVASLSTSPRAPMRRHEGGYYVRLSVQDRIGAIAAIATRMAARDISFDSIMQKNAPADAASALPAGFVSVVLITHATTEAAIREALDAVEHDGYIAGKPQLIRLERE